jgi:hypothetical protein
MLYKQFSLRVTVAAFGLTFAAGVNVATAEAVTSADLASHQAFYDLELKSVAGSANLIGIVGKTHYTLEKVCDGWISSENSAISLNYDAGEVLNFISYYEIWESAEGTALTFRYVENSDVDGERYFEGYANSENGVVEAYHSDADGAVRELPSNTLFPIHHMAQLLQRAEAGSPPIQPSNVFFGGASDDALYFASAVTGQKREVAADNVLGLLGQDGYWPLTIAYFSLETLEAEPDYAITFEMQSNGIVRNYVVDYGDFSMRAELKKIDPIDEKKCL